jgi:branched-chain amino acid transport system permease protein
MLITVFFILSILKSNFGNVLKSIRDDEIAARTMGINTTVYRTMAFCVGGFFAGVGGALLGSLITTIEPKMFNFQLTFNILLIVVAGGLGSVTGSLVGSAVITLLLEWLRIVEYPLTIGSLHLPGIPGMRMVIFALVLMLIIIFRRKGLIGSREFSWDVFYELPSTFHRLISRRKG